MKTMTCPGCGKEIEERDLRCPSCGEDAPTLAPSQPSTLPLSGKGSRAFPETFGRFRIVREIGRGGMGVVYEAEDSRLLRTVALKTLFGKHDERSEARFLREARIAGTLDHPNVVSVHDFGTVDGVSYYTMPLVRGPSLEKIIAFLHGRGRGAFPESLAIPEEFSEKVRVVLVWFEQVLAGLHHAHRKGIVHRDLKPSNLILDMESGRLRITDFGLARAHHLAALTQKDILMGTVAYMAPEQIRGDAKQIDPRSDIYAMGVTLYQTLLDKLPYSARSTAGYLECILSSTPELDAGDRKRIHPDLATILLKCMEKIPAHRYPTALALAEDLGRFRRYEPIRARRIGPTGRLMRWARRRPTTAVLTLILLIVTIGAGVLFRSQVEASRLLRRQEHLQAIEAGKELEASDDHARAVKAFTRALELDPTSFAARMGRAVSLASVPGRGGQAIEDLRVADRLHPDLSSVHLLRSRLLRKRGDLEEAEREEKRAGELAPQIALDHYYLGQVARLDGDCPAAIEQYTAAARLDPQDAWSILFRGMCLKAIGDLTHARIDYEIAAHLMPDHASPHNNLANVLKDQEKLDRAREEYGRALDLEPDNATIHFNLALLLEQLERSEDAEVQYRRALEIDPELSAARNALGFLMLDSGRVQEAIPQFRQAIRVEESRGEAGDTKTLADAYANLCDAHLTLRARGDAEAPCEKALALAPGVPDSQYNMASYRMLAHDPSGALDALEKDVALGDRHADYLLGDPLFASLRNHPRFIALVERMRSEDQAQPAATTVP
ncbi:MAG: tetratricopeptide repeat protein [Acidobacteriota bacterium]